MSEDELIKYHLWLCLNSGRNTVLDENKIKWHVQQFKNATGKGWTVCHCKDKGKVVNSFFDTWHCSYCLLPKSEK